MIGARSEAGIRRVARMGCHFLPIGEKRDVELYRAACAECGRPPGQVRILRSCYVAEDYERERGQLWPHMKYLLDSYTQWMFEADDTPGDKRKLADGFRDVGNFFAGTAGEVVDQIGRFRDDVRPDEIVLIFHFPGLDWKVSRRSMERFAARVLPHIR